MGDPRRGRGRREPCWPVRAPAEAMKRERSCASRAISPGAGWRSSAIGRRRGGRGREGAARAHTPEDQPACRGFIANLVAAGSEPSGRARRWWWARRPQAPARRGWDDDHRSVARRYAKALLSSASTTAPRAHGARGRTLAGTMKPRRSWPRPWPTRVSALGPREGARALLDRIGALPAVIPSRASCSTASRQLPARHSALADA